MKKYVIITVISALLASAAVLVGIPLYKSWADTSNCLSIVEAALVAPEDPDYPCAWIFGIKHKGIGGSHLSCDCNHSNGEDEEDHYVTLFIYNQSRTVIEYSTRMSVVAEYNQCTTVDSKYWCTKVHVPGGNYYAKCVCSYGEESGWKDFTSEPDNCNPLIIIWDSGDCD